MSIILNVEKYMKRYDYLIEKRERKYKQGKRLSPEDDDELQKLRPNVVAPIFVMFELLYETIKENQEHRKTSKHIINQTGGTNPAVAPAAPPPAVAPAAAAVAAAAAAAVLHGHTPSPAAATSAAALHSHAPSPTAATTPETSERKRLSELEESLLPLLTQIIIYLEENKKAMKESSEEGGGSGSDEKYPDIGTTAKNSAILVVRRIKKWWNELTSGGSSDLSSKINLKKMLPQLANNPVDMNNLTQMAELNKLADKATDAIHGPLQKIERILSNDVRDIASSSVEGIMNALSLIPGIGTTLQLWRLLQNVIVIMSKSVTTMAETKKEGSIMKEKFQGLQADIENIAANPSELANAAANSVMSQVQGAAKGTATDALSQIKEGAAGAVSDMASQFQKQGTDTVSELMSQVQKQGTDTVSGLLSQGKKEGTKLLSGAVSQFQKQGTDTVSGLMSKGNGAFADAAKSMPKAITGQAGGGQHKTNHLRSIKKYKREYKQSIREIRKTRKNILRCIKNMI